MKPFIKKNYERTVAGVTEVCIQALTKAGKVDEAKALAARTANAASYEEALNICLDYVVIDFG